MSFKKILLCASILFCACASWLPLLADAPAPQGQPPPPKTEKPATPPTDIPPPHLEPPFHTEMNAEQATVSYEGAFIKMIVTLVGLVLAIFLTIWILRKLGQGRFRGIGSSRSIKILEKRPLSPKSILYLVEIGNKQVLIAESQVEVRRLAVLEEIPGVDE